WRRVARRRSGAGRRRVRRPCGRGVARSLRRPAGASLPRARSDATAVTAAPEVVCLGILVADVIASPVDELPPRRALGFVDGGALRGGGCALKAATALARLGVASGVAGKVGADPFGDFVLGLLDERGIDRRGVVVDPAVSTSATVVLVDAEGERTFLHLPGANG